MTERTTSTEPATSDTDRLVAVLWGRRPASTRGPKAVLTIDRIVTSALAIADAEGIEAVSMQRVAEAVGYTKMALYRHVRAKDELLAVMIDAAVGPPPDLGHVPGGWRGRVEVYATDLWETWQRHPWLPAVTVGPRVMGPNEVDWTELAIDVFDGSGLDADESIDAALLVSGHVRTIHDRSPSGTFPWTDDRRITPFLADILRQQPERFPALLRTIDSSSRRPAQPIDESLGLRCILDGLEQRVAQRRSAKRRRPATRT